MRQRVLTIAVPTFNRRDNLLHLMRQVLPQLDERTGLLVLDNASDQPVKSYLESLLEDYPAAQAQVIRNRHNIGANANILRCFELSETPWIWVVGDDDEVEPDAVSTILARLDENPDALLINFPIDGGRTSPRTVHGLREFTDALDPSADLPWIASTVYRAPELMPQLRFGYQYAFSMLPHVAMLLMAFRKDHAVCFATDRIARRDRAAAPTDQQTPIVNMALGFPVLLDLPIDLGVRRDLVRKLLVTTDAPGLPLKQLAYQLMLQSALTGDRQNSLYVFDQACRRRFYFDRTLRERAEMTAYRMLLTLPPALAGAAYNAVKRRPLTSQVVQDRVGRL